MHLSICADIASEDVINTCEIDFLGSERKIGEAPAAAAAAAGAGLLWEITVKDCPLVIVVRHERSKAKQILHFLQSD